MQKNIGTIDRILRLVAGVALLLWVTMFSGPTWAYIGVVPLVTAMLSRCPAYTLLGVNTTK